MGLISWECLLFKSILCAVKAVERQHVLSEQFLIQNTVLVKGLKLSSLNEDLKYNNKNHPVDHKITAHFQRDLILMLMESIKLISIEPKLTCHWFFTERQKQNRSPSWRNWYLVGKPFCTFFSLCRVGQCACYLYRSVAIEIKRELCQEIKSIGLYRLSNKSSSTIDFSLLITPQSLKEKSSVVTSLSFR